MRFAYADPPYPGLAARYYKSEETFAGEVDHVELIASLEAAAYDGWALSTSARALRELLPLCPPDARVCPWVKPGPAHPATHGMHNLWEPLIVVGGRQRQPGKRDYLLAKPARRGGELPGRKPLAFCAWLFDCLGMVAGDELVDLFPGTGIVARAWSEVSRDVVSDASRASLLEPADASSAGVGDVSSAVLGDDVARLQRRRQPLVLVGEWEDELLRAVRGEPSLVAGVDGRRR